jgi:hypothetical protein
VSGAADAADVTPAEQANLKLVADFCSSWSTRDMTRILPFLATDCVYRMTETTPPANGHDGVVQKLKQWLRRRLARRVQDPRRESVGRSSSRIGSTGS